MILSTDVWYGFQWFGIPITDWVIALMSILGTAFAVVGYFQLIKNDSRQQLQIDQQQFENSFLKLLDNHLYLLKSFEVNLPSNVQLDKIVEDIKSNAISYNNSLASNRIIKFSMFDYNPLTNPRFQIELVKRGIKDINHIGNFISTKKYLTKKDRTFYFTTLFNSLYESEKYLYGYQSYLKLKDFLNNDSEKINAKFNDYFNSLPDNLKIKHSDIEHFYPIIRVSLNDSYDQHVVSLLELQSKPPKAIFRNCNSFDLIIKKVSIFCKTETDNESDRILLHDEIVLNPNMNFELVLFDFINANYFENKLEILLTQVSELNSLLQEIKKKSMNNYLLELSIDDENKRSFKYQGELIFFIPDTINHWFETRMS
jgi:hypothetical protein